MKLAPHLARRQALAALLLVAAAAPALAEDQSRSYQSLLTPLLESGTDVLGEPLVYPKGALAVTAAIVELPPGAETGWHSHEVPLFAHVVEGEFTVDYGEKGRKTYRAGDSVLEAMHWPHNGVNSGSVPMKLIAVYMGGGDSRNTVPAAVP